MQDSTVASVSTRLRSGDAAGALLLLDDALRTDQRNVKLWTLKGFALDQLGRADDAAAAYAQALLLSPEYLPALQGLSQVQYRQGNPAAMIPLQKVLRLHGEDATAHAMLAVLLYHAHDCPAALEHFQAAHIGESNDLTALQEFAACLTDTLQYAEATTVLTKVLTQMPADTNARFNLALVQLLDHHADEAATTLQPLLDRPSPGSSALRLGAEIEQQRGNLPLAVERLRKALQLDPKDEQAYVQFASLANDAASFQAGVTLLNLGLGQLPNSAPLYLARGVLYSQLARYDEAVADFDHANRIDPQLAMLGAAQGVMQTQRKQDTTALETFRTAARQRPADALTKYLLAEALIQRNPQVAPADRAEAINAAEQALKLDPSLTAAHDLLATIYLQTEQYQLAQQHSEQALRQEPNDEQAVYHLILILRKSDRKGEVPGLVRRLSELRELHARQGIRYQLTVPGK